MSVPSENKKTTSREVQLQELSELLHAIYPPLIAKVRLAEADLLSNANPDLAGPYLDAEIQKCRRVLGAPRSEAA